MTWAVLTEAGRVAGLYQRQGGAVLNARGRAVVEVPAEVAAAPTHWRFGEGFAWVFDPAPDPNAARLAAMSRDERRRLAYGAGDRDRMLEVALEVVLDLAETPEVWALLRQTTRDKLDAVKDEIAAVKAANP
jgi:hypothetical protein